MKTLKLNLLALMMIIGQFLAAQQSYGEIRGILKNDLKEMVPFATVKIMQGGALIGGTQSDIEGNYHFKPLEPGKYDVVVMEAGHKAKQISGVKVIPNEPTYLNIKLQSNTLGTVEVVGTIQKEDYTQSGCNTSMFSMVSLDATELMQNASFDHANLMTAVTAVSSDVIETPDGGYHFRGSRSDANAVYMDGVKLLDMGGVPGLSIENMTVFSGGVPAMYGDVTVGVIVVTSKSYFSGIREKNMRNQRLKEQRAAKEERRKEEEEKAQGVIYN
jgi:hypothetical protein